MYLGHTLVSALGRRLGRNIVHYDVAFRGRSNWKAYRTATKSEENLFCFEYYFCCV